MSNAASSVIFSATGGFPRFAFLASALVSFSAAFFALAAAHFSTLSAAFFSLAASFALYDHLLTYIRQNLAKQQ